MTTLELLVRAPAAQLPPSSAAAADGSDAAASAADWSRVIAAVRALGVDAQQQLAAAQSELAALDADAAGVSSDATAEVTQRVWGTGGDIDALRVDAEAAARHFRDVAACAAPAQQRLAALEARAAYLRAALDVERLSARAETLAQEAADEAALEAFRELTTFASALPAEFAHVRAVADARLLALSGDLQTFAVAELQRALAVAAWPSDDAAADATDESDVGRIRLAADVGRAFGFLLTLQLSQATSASSATADLWAVEVLLEPVLARFRFHFERAESPTNRLAKPEWMLSHVLSQVRAFAPFLAATVGPELDKQSAALSCSDAQVLVLRGFIRAAQRKLRKDIPRLISQKALFCHTLDEVLLFEQAIDDAFGYSSWANSDRSAFERCVDVFTEQMPVFIAWTSVDAEYATYMLARVIFEDRKKAWEVAGDELLASADLETPDTDSSDRGVPCGALHFAALLDFMCRRFAFMASEEHRFLYLSQVLHVLLREMLRECESHARAINVRNAGSDVATAVAEVCAVINAAQYVVRLLSVWEQSSLFIELMKKVVQSEKSRSQVLKIHLEYSKSVLKNAAHAASSAVLAREEAVAVRQAIAGPGSLIGPTAAFSAAYSVGSKTVMSLLGRADADQPEAPQAAHPVAGNEAKEAPLDDDEELIFSRSIFERQIADLKEFLQRLLQSVADVAVSKARRDVRHYELSLFAGADVSDDEDMLLRDVSPELGACFTRLDCVLAQVRKLLSAENRSQIAKIVASALDEVFFGALLNGSSDSFSSQHPRCLAPRARTQFETDVATLSRVLERCAPRSSKHLRAVTDLVNLTRVGAAQLREIRSALHESASSGMEQLTTMLEVSGVHTMTPEQVLAACDLILA